MQCTLCNTKLVKIDEYGGRRSNKNHYENHPIIIIYQCPECDQIYEVKKSTGEFINDESVVCDVVEQFKEGHYGI